MINLFVLQNGRLSQEQVEDRNELLQYSNPIWIDVVDPEEEELIWIKEAFGVLLPELDDLGDLEASARYFEADDGHLHIRTDFLLDEEETSRNVRVAFVLTKQVLFSIHDEDLPVFRLVRLRARLRPGSVSNAKDVLLDLYSTDAEYSADALEEVYENLEQAGKRVLQDDINDADAEQVLETIAKEEDTNGRIRRNVMDTRRALSFLMRSKLLSDEQRLTSFGKFLRKSSLDEIPQFWNVLKGDMSLIGPRPLLIEYIPMYTPEERKRHLIKPGITGWAQVNGRNSISWEEKFALDVWYVNHASFLLDIKIIFITIFKIFKKEGINQNGEATMKPFKR